MYAYYILVVQHFHLCLSWKSVLLLTQMKDCMIMKLYRLYLDYHQIYNSVYLDLLYILEFLNIKIYRLENGLSFEVFTTSVVYLAIIYVAIVILSHKITHIECTIWIFLSVTVYYILFIITKHLFLR